LEKKKIKIKRGKQFLKEKKKHFPRAVLSSSQGICEAPSPRAISRKRKKFKSEISIASKT